MATWTAKNFSTRFTGSARSLSIIYVTPVNETITQQFIERRDRPVDEWMRDIIPQALKHLGMEPTTKVKWSQQAGCRCGCSPGFKISGKRGVNVFVDAAISAPEVAAEPAAT